MKILITGSSGFLGNEIVKALTLNNVLTLNRSSSYYNIDLSKSIPIFDQNFDLIIHAAGKAHFIPRSDFECSSIFEINVVGTKNLLKGLSKLNSPKYFIFISSVSVYGILSGENIKEDSKLNADDPYGKSKIEAENIVKKWCNEHNVICTILRLPLVVGENAPGNLGAMIRGIKRGYYFNIACGNAKKSMVLATDVAKFILKSAETGGTYNLTDGYHPTFKELSKNIASHMGKHYVPNMPKLFAYILAKFGDHLGSLFPINSDKYFKITSTLTFDDTKARTAFGWNPSPVLDFFKIQRDAQ